MKLKVTTNSTFATDDIQQTVVGYGENFKTIEKYLTETTTSPELIATGQYFEKGKILYNRNPVIGGHVGWVNIREGYHAPLWESKKVYTVGEQVKAKPDNGNIYQCVTAGRAMANSPTFLTGKNVEFYDANGNKWFPNYNYSVNDVVFAVNGSKIYYYICETAGYSSSSEPSWASVQAGTTVIDGTVVWRKETTIKWKQIDVSSNFRPFGKIE